MIQIQEEVATGGRLYSIAGGSSCSIASYQWILTPFGTSQKIIVGSNNTYFKSDPQTTGDEITVTVTNFTETYWTGGEFYGGDFRGNFGGGMAPEAAPSITTFWASTLPASVAIWSASRRQGWYFLSLPTISSSVGMAIFCVNTDVGRTRCRFTTIFPPSFR